VTTTLPYPVAPPVYVTEAMYLEDRRLMFAAFDKLSTGFESFAAEMRAWRQDVDSHDAVADYKDGQANQRRTDNRVFRRDVIKIWVGCTVSAAFGALAVLVGAN